MAERAAARLDDGEAGMRSRPRAERGIDPVRNPGVYRFKRASGAEPIELLGEWDWASRPWLRWVGNWAIAQRARVRRAETMLNRAPANQQTQPVPAASTRIQYGES